MTRRSSIRGSILRRPGTAGYPRQVLVVLAGLCLAAGVLSSCGGSGKTKLTVLAASSLTESFTELKKTYETAHPDVQVALSFDSSSTLAQQVIAGSPADVLATADPQTMQMVVAKHDVSGTPTTFATNTLVLVTPRDNPGTISSIADLSRPGVKFATCVPSAPCGDAADRLLAKDGITAKPATQQENVKSVLALVTSGEVDAGFVYVTDAMAAGSAVRTIQVPHAKSIVNDYPIAVLTSSREATAAQEWVSLVTSSAGQQVLTTFGFGKPR
ncbi:MAG: molybdate ABC transporter substrate-binding protein [Nocardioidaceae bacterium]